MVAAAAGAMLAGGGCLQFAGQTPAGPHHSADMYTYESTRFTPQTVTLVDLRTQEELWTTDVPVGQRLVVRFFDNANEGTEQFPAQMRWALMDAGGGPRPLANEVVAPPQDARRLDVEFRDAPEEAPEEPGSN